jgi:hypothetical protein
MRRRCCSKSGGTAEPPERLGVDAEMAEHRRCDVDNRPDRRVHADGDDRDLRVAGCERSVRAAAEVMTSAEVGELPPLRGGDEDVAGVRRRERRPRARRRIGAGEQRAVARQAPVSSVRCEAELLAAASRDRLVAHAEQRHLDRRRAVEESGELAWIVPAAGEPVHHRGSVRCRDERALDPGEGLLQGRHLSHTRLAVVGEDDEGVSLDQLVETAGREGEIADGGVAATKHVARRIGSVLVGGEVVVGEVVDEEVEAVAGDEPAADGGGVRVDRARRTVAPAGRRAGLVRFVQVVEEEAARPQHRPAPEERYGRGVERAAAVAREVDGCRHDPRVVERLEHGDRRLAQVVGVHVHDRVANGLGQPGRAHRREG